MTENLDHLQPLPELDAAMSALSDQQAEFVKLILQGLNQTEAARLAGYTGKHVASTASRLMGKPAIQRALTALAEAQAEQEEQGTREWIKKMLQQIALTGHPSSRVGALKVLNDIQVREDAKGARDPIKVFMERWRNGEQAQLELESWQLIERELELGGAKEVAGYPQEIRDEILRIAKLAASEFESARAGTTSEALTTKEVTE